MSTDTVPPAVPLPSNIPPDVLADLQAVCEAVAAGQRPAPELARRVRERAAKATEDIYRRHGLLNVAVDLIREGRDEE